MLAIFCRRMVFDECDPKLLEAAGPSLQSLTLNCGWSPLLIENMEEEVEHHLGRLTGMTKLELSSYKATSHSHLATLRSLGLLRELTLLDCVNIQAAIFKPGALTALEVLHIEESLEARKKRLKNLPQADPAEMEASKRQLHEAGAVVLRLPKLRQLSGTSPTLFTWMDPASQGPAKLWTRGKMKRQLTPKDDRAPMIHTYFKM